MRVFIGIKATGEIQKQIIDWQEKHKSLPVRFVKPQNLHLTLVPPWHENNIKKFVKTLNKFSFPKTFEITFDSVSKGPQLHPRLIWTTGHEQENLTKLGKVLTKFLKKSKQTHSLPHITIARFKMKEAVLVPEINETIDLKLDISEITLFESILSPRGAEYSVIEKVRLVNLPTSNRMC